MTPSETEISFFPLPITGTIGCCVPVLPGTTQADAPLEERTELCAIDANWIVGMVPICDLHVRTVCEITGIDWPALIAEAGRDLEHAQRPASERQRHPQPDTRDHLAHFTRDRPA